MTETYNIDCIEQGETHSCSVCGRAQKTERGCVCPVLGINLSQEFSDIISVTNTCKDFMPLKCKQMTLFGGKEDGETCV